MDPQRHLSILGGGPAGLAVAYYARKRGVPFTLYEAADEVGGNCRTIQSGEFRYDTGAHRLHNKLPAVTREVQHLMGAELQLVEAPSAIYEDGRYVDFPLSPLNLLRHIGSAEFVRAGSQIIGGRLSRKGTPRHFQAFAERTYGKSLAGRFLLRYSEKLWGVPCDQLSTAVSGKRLKGLDLRTFLTETLLGRRAKTRHLDGSFYYPRRGYGSIMERMAAVCGAENLRTSSRITALAHENNRVTAIEIGGGERVAVDRVVSSLPLPLVVRGLWPAAPARVRELAAGLRYRDLLLVVLFLDRPSVTSYASVYFPDGAFPFTRISEPRNRSPLMSPPGKTSLIVEIPCQREDAFWSKTDARLAEHVREDLARIGWIREGDLIGHEVRRIPSAYPILTVDHEAIVAQIADYLRGFENLRLCGRNGLFAYLHLHDVMRDGQHIIDGMLHCH